MSLFVIIYPTFRYKDIFVGRNNHQNLFISTQCCDVCRQWSEQFYHRLSTSPVNYSKQIEVKMNINLENTVRCSRGHMQSSRCSSGRMRGFRHCSGHVRGSVCRVGRVRASTSPSQTSTSFPATRGLSCSALSERREKSEAATDIINQPSQNISSPQYLLTRMIMVQNRSLTNCPVNCLVKMCLNC